MGNNGLGLYQNKYRIPSNRFRDWDYANNGHYFITLVTFGRRCLFGEIVDNKMVLNDIGNIICDVFFKSFEIRTDLYLGEFVVMPNHIHTIVIMDRKDCVRNETHGSDETHGCASLRRQPRSVSSFVAGFKSATIKGIDDWIDANGNHINKFGRSNPLWQANYYDHIVRNADEYKMIAKYIIENPFQWSDDSLSKPLVEMHCGASNLDDSRNVCL